MFSTNCDKFLLLLWKNCILQMNHKYLCVVEICVPVIFTLLLVFLRSLIDSEAVGITRYNQTFEMNNFDLLRKNVSNTVNYALGYSPNTCKFCRKIMYETARQTSVGLFDFEDSKELATKVAKYGLIAGVDFGDNNKNAVAYPRKFIMTIRFPSELRTTQKIMILWETNHLYAQLDPFGPRNRLDQHGGIPSGYFSEGFLTIQHQVALAYIKQASKKSNAIPKIKFKRFPYPPFVEDTYLHILSQIMSLIILLCYIQPVTYTVKYVALEKEKQLKEVLKIMGLQNWIHWTAWFVKCFITMVCSTVLIVLAITVNWTNNLAVLPFSSPSVFFFFLLCYIISTITFCFMIATFFNSAGTAAAVTGLYWFLSYLPYTYINLNYDHVSPTIKILCCLLSNTSMGLGTHIIIEWEMSGRGLNWNNLFEQPTATDPIKMIHIIYLLLFTAIIHMIICLYLEQVNPGSFGIPKPWYFPFKKSYWFGEPEVPKALSTTISRKAIRTPLVREDPTYFEKEPDFKETGVVVRDLCKTFGSKQVVKNLSFDLYVNEITVLLGHNGAGKTTTISMLIGMIPPTSGTAYIMEHSIVTETVLARESLSICPQYNVLFDDLTVTDHLKFFSYLRGLRGEALKDEVQTYLKKIDLEKKKNTLSANLSGGMKRKLSVCCALCGGPQVVLCDEPSSGMDPTARRQLWNILQKEKAGRTILLTTHFMDEADVLADRVAVMAGGTLKCFGTPFFLKKKIGTGYTLVCVKDGDCDSNKVTEYLQTFISGLEVAFETDTEISYNLEDKYSSVFSKMLSGLEEKSPDLKISGFGLANTSLEEVFMKMGAETYVTDATKFKSESEYLKLTSDRLKGVKLTCCQIYSMILKKYLATLRNYRLMAIKFLIIIIFVVLTVLVKATDVFRKQPAITIELQQYHKATVVLESTNDTPKSFTRNVIENYKRYVQSAGPNYKILDTGGLPFEDYILSYPIEKQYYIDKEFVAGATLKDNEYLVWLNNKPLHSAPLTLNILHNGIAKSLLGEDTEIVVINFPLPFATQTVATLADTGLGLGTQIATNFPFCMSIITALFALFIIRERQNKAKLLQFVSGVQVLTFWLPHYIWDFIYLTLLSLVLVVTLGMFQEESYETFDQLSRNFIIFVCFAIPALPLTYLMARQYTEPVNGFAKISVYNIFFGVGIFTVALILSFEIFDLRDVGYNIETFALVYPHFALGKALHSLYINHMLHSACEPLFSIPAADRCEYYPACCKMTPYYAWDRPGIGRPLIYLVVTGIVYCIIVYCIQIRLTGVIWDKVKLKQSQRKYTDQPTKFFDSDVDAERKLIDKMKRADVNQYNLVVKRLTKYYGKFLAVNQLSVAVKQAECFGLLGLNGAGKTTTFKMLTLDERITFGTAYVKGMNIQTKTRNVFQEIGYCPQFDALFDEFTGRENLHIYAMIHGIPKTKRAELSEKLAKAFGFRMHYDNKVGHYSGGNKRKLSTAIAIIGDPSVVLLDEPTSGMDPASRRRLWNVLTSIRQIGKSIVLTSHSMDECEALCTRMAIMVSGEFRCLGSIQHLRIKFSQGLTLRLKLTTEKTSKIAIAKAPAKGAKPIPDNIEETVEAWVKQNFPNATLIDKFQGLLSFNIPMAPKLWSNIFGKVEASKASLNIEDYSISQTDLEDIFVYFTK